MQVLPPVVVWRLCYQQYTYLSSKVAAMRYKVVSLQASISLAALEGSNRCPGMGNKNVSAVAFLHASCMLMQELPLIYKS